METEQLQAELEKLKAELRALDEINKALVAEIESIKVSSAPAAQDSPKTSEKTFVRNGVEYGFTYPGINYKGEVITADHVLASEDLQDELISIKSGFIKQIS